MTSCEIWHGRIAAGLYGELGATEADRLAAHLEGCQGCAEVHRELAEVRDLITDEAPPVPELADMWNRLEPRLRSAPPARPRLAVAAAAAAVVVIATMWSTDVTRAPAPPLERVADGAPATATGGRLVSELDARRERFLARTEPLLIALSNRDLLVPAIAPEAERRLAAALALEASELAPAVAAASQRREARLIRRLERILIQVANTSGGADPLAVSVVQAALARDRILLRLTVDELRRAGRPTS